MALAPAVEGRAQAVDTRRSSVIAGMVPAVALCVAGLSVLGLALRLTWVFYTDTIPLGGDPHWYYVVGINLSKGLGFVANRNEIFEVPGPGQPTAFWPPAYPFALAAVFKLFGVSVTAAQVLNAVLGALTIPFVYALGSKILNRPAGLLAAALFACFPNAIGWTPVLFPEPLFVLLFVAALWVLVAAPAGGRGAWLALAGFGALAGLATLTRGQGAVLVPIAVSYWLSRSGWRATLRSTALSLLVAAAVIAPWTIRNAVQLHAFIPISTNSGAALRAGHAPDATGTTYWPRDRIDGFYMWQSLYRPDWEVRGYREYTKRAIDYAFTHPQRELELTGDKIYHLYRSDAGVIPWLTTLGATPIEPQALEDALWRVFDYSYYVLLFGALLSIPLWLRRDANRWLPVAIVALWTLYHIVFLGEPRYHVPLYPVFAIALAGGLWTVVVAARGALERWRPRTLATAVTTPLPSHAAETSA